MPVERKINDKALNEDITLSASDIGAAAIEHGEHVPSVQAADNSIFLRNDNSWKPVTPKNIGAATEEQGQKADYAIQGIQVNGVYVSPDLNRYVNVTIEDLEAVPKERKINNKSLEFDIALTAADVGAAEVNHSHAPQEINAATAEQGMKADLAVQGVKLNGSLIIPDAENVVDIEVSELGGATAEQGAKADSALQGVKVNGTLLEADSQNIVDVIVSGGGGSSSVTYTAEIGTNWVAAETGEYTQTVVVNGILATDNPIVDVVLDTAKNTALSQLEAWSLISKIETSNGSITVTCLEEAPTTAILIQIKVVR